MVDDIYFIITLTFQETKMLFIFTNVLMDTVNCILIMNVLILN